MGISEGVGASAGEHPSSNTMANTHVPGRAFLLSAESFPAFPMTTLAPW
jgi:hypothetical protein